MKANTVRWIITIWLISTILARIIYYLLLGE